MAVLDGRVVFAAADERDLVAVDFRLPLTRRPLQAVDRRAGRSRFDPALSRLAGIVANVIRISVGRGFACAGVLVAELCVGWIGKPSEHSRPIRVIFVLADRPQALTIRDLVANVVG